MRPTRVSRRRTSTRNPIAAAAASAAVAGVAPPAPSLEQFAFVPVSDVKPPRRKPGTIKTPKALRQRVVFSAGLQAPQQYTQASNIPLSSGPGVSALANLLAGPSATAQKLDLDDRMMNFLGPAGFDPAYDEFGGENPDTTRHRRRRRAQHETWRDQTVPDLVRPYLRLLHGQPAPPRPRVCACSGLREYTVTLADWDTTSSRSWQSCKCSPLAQQLVETGYFPCAPKRPSMAFSIRLLEFISLHSLHVAPNTTAWASTLEKFWDRRGHTIPDKRAFRRRLGNALQWYQVLVNQKNRVVTAALSEYRLVSAKAKHGLPSDTADDSRPSKRLRLSEDTAGQEEDHVQEPQANDEHAPDAQSSTTKVASTRPSGETSAYGPSNPSASREISADGQTEGGPPRASARSGDDERPDASAHRGEETRGHPHADRIGASPRPDKDASGQRVEAGNQRPSEYLRERCHLCFGGKRPELGSTRAHAIVCIDANFGQKRRKSKYSDPPLFFEGGCFVSPAEVAEMEEEVERKRKRAPKARTKGTSSLDDDILDECESSFIAAQEKVTKASKNYYSDTGLMAIICRHDNVLYIVNMTTPGERQHYALVLLRKLFAGLPSDWNVGLLYDIACQLSRSMEKFDLLGDLLDRLTFGVSVFHAYGHQWACQLVFHPRKRDGFGLSDGEGCERFWSAIRVLIPCLRVSGYFRRMFVLDRQITHIQGQNVFKFGRWLARKSRETARRLAEAQLSLEACAVEEHELRAQWTAQKASQLQPAPRQSKYAGDKAVDNILLDLAHADELREDLREDRAKLRKTAHNLSTWDVQQLSDRIDQKDAQLKATRARIDLARSQLGTGALRQFDAMRGDAYIRTRVNARAVRVQIRMAIQAHKFEREKLERNYRRHIMCMQCNGRVRECADHLLTENKDHAQIRDLVHSREKNLSALVRKFNGLVTHMELLVRNSKGPRRRMRLPRHLDSKKLFRLDVDDDIWQEDPGLGPQDEGDLPAWQVDAKVRRGIRALLEVDRCHEEQERLSAEARALATWWTEERAILDAFCASSTDELLVAEARVQRSRFDLLALEWNSELAVCELGVYIGNGTTSICSPARVSIPLPQAASPGGSDSDSDIDPGVFSSEDESSDDEEDVHLVDAAGQLDTDLDSEDGCQSPTSPARASVAPIFPASPSRHPSPGPPRVRNGRAFSPSAIDLSSSDDDADSKGRAAPELGRMAGRFSCSGDDVLRMASATRWLSGSGLSVFAESHRLDVNDPRIGHLPSTFLVDVHEYSEASKRGDSEKMQANRDWIERQLRRLPPPSSARKWLVTAHITSPQHWTLVEVRWDLCQLRFYDSLADTDSYALHVKKLMLMMLTLCEQLYNVPLDVASWEWVPEKRGKRQTNWSDCGPFVAADFVGLLRSDLPSTKRQTDMKDWRVEMAAHMRRLPVYKPGRPAPLTAEQEKDAISISD